LLQLDGLVRSVSGEVRRPITSENLQSIAARQVKILWPGMALFVSAEGLSLRGLGQRIERIGFYRGLFFRSFFETFLPGPLS
jgi:hypothetical protein